ncbi:hypothetical protein CH249_12515 [Rhodococcus sp. 05-2255-3B1]|nr:hypothetical protein CH250_21145 [Rhodococcus sp. 05-2255-3C]OZE10600.1 hypothetical protein CH249_12515 [Rhodococcus sp. 05-2255-3B1]OZE20675.1 hypothetical protein CH255_08685 [Rhodococcus sp. 05-2255-2A2]
MILVTGDAHMAARRIGVVAAFANTNLWTTLGRSTTTHSKGDLASPADPTCQLDKPGWWSERFQHTIDGATFGDDVLCPFYGHLQEPARSAFLDFCERIGY